MISDVGNSRAQTDISDNMSKSIIPITEIKSKINECSFQNKQNTECTTITEPRKSNRIKNLPAVSYNEDDISDYILCVQSIICNISNSYQEINNRADRLEWQHAINKFSLT